ncbi:sensor histidine kinase [Paenibacillus humicola]|uniref:sensor histidine kinase n=1 Tax=Paenibacillus humicola TaxID=3110540 RepID=UPI00237BC657|nr:histidine kinase [Paenibacillus humicola]
MEGWAISYKAVLLLYVFGAAFFDGGHTAGQELELLSFLLYVCLNIAVYIWRGKRPKQAMIGLSIALAALCASSLHPLFALLLPFNIYELAAFHIKRGRLLIPLALLPALFITRPLLLQYGFAAVSGYLLFAMMRLFAARFAKFEQSQETMRADIQRLSQVLNENEEYLKQSDYTARLEERNRLSQQIHDQVGHAMSGALIQMEASKRLLASNAEQASQLLQNAIAISKDGIESIRQTLKSTKPPIEQLGINRLRLAIDEFTGTHGLAASLTHSGDLDAITPLQWKIIQENMAEAMTNAVKYAGATRIEADVTVLNTFIKAVVADNGKGAAKVVKGLGIIGMEERAAAVNGTVIVDGTRGFSVTTLIPYRRLPTPSPERPNDQPAKREHALGEGVNET